MSVINPNEYLRQIEILLKMDPHQVEEKDFETMNFFLSSIKNYLGKSGRLDQIETNFIRKFFDYKWGSKTRSTMIFSKLENIMSWTEEYLKDIKNRFEIVFSRCNNLIRELTGQEFGQRPGLVIVFLIYKRHGTLETLQNTINVPLSFFFREENERNSVFVHELLHYFFNINGGWIARFDQASKSFFTTYVESRKWLVNSLNILSTACLQLGKKHKLSDLVKLGNELNEYVKILCIKMENNELSPEELFDYYNKLYSYLARVNRLLKNKGFNEVIEIIEKTTFQFKDLLNLLHKVAIQDLKIITSACEEGFSDLFALIYCERYNEKFFKPLNSSIDYKPARMKALELYKRNPKIFKIFFNLEEFRKIRHEFEEVIKRDREWVTWLGRRMYRLGIE